MFRLSENRLGKALARLPLFSLKQPANSRRVSMGWDHSAIPLTYLGHYSGSDALASTSTAAATNSPSCRKDRSVTMETELGPEETEVEERAGGEAEMERVENATGAENVKAVEADVHVAPDVPFKTTKVQDDEPQGQEENEEGKGEEEEEARGATGHSFMGGPNISMAFLSSVDFEITPVEEVESSL